MWKWWESNTKERRDKTKERKTNRNIRKRAKDKYMREIISRLISIRLDTSTIVQISTVAAYVGIYNHDIFTIRIQYQIRNVTLNHDRITTPLWTQGHEKQFYYDIPSSDRAVHRTRLLQQLLATVPMRWVDQLLFNNTVSTTLNEQRLILPNFITSFNQYASEASDM